MAELIIFPGVRVERTADLDMDVLITVDLDDRSWQRLCIAAAREGRAPEELASEILANALSGEGAAIDGDDA